MNSLVRWLACVSLMTAALAQQAPHLAQSPLLPMTVAWMFGPEAGAVASVPKFAWLEGGSLLICDTRRPERERMLELLDPATGHRTPALDQAKALRSLGELLEGNPVPAVLPWPDGLSTSGLRALYRFPGSLCVLDLPSATFHAIPGKAEDLKAATLSPDGTRVAYVRGHDLFVWDLARGDEKRITRDGSDSVLNGRFSWVYWEELYNHEEAAYWWSPDSRSLAFLRSDESHVPTHSFIDFRPFEPKVHVQRYPKVGQANPEVRLGLATVAGEGVRWMSLEPDAYEYLVRVTWLPASDAVAVQTMNRAQTELSLHRVETASGHTTRLLQETDAAWLHFYDPIFLKDGKQFLWVSDRSGHAHIYRYGMDGALLNPVTQGAWSLWPWGEYSGGHSGLTAVDEKGGWVYFTARASSPFERQLYRSRLEGGGLMRLSTEPGAHLPSFSPDRQYYLDIPSSASMPPALILRKVDGSRLLDLAPPRRDRLQAFGMQYPVFFPLPAADGVSLPARISKPRDFDATKKYPVIFYIYGGPGAPSVLDAWDSNGWSQSIHFDQMLLDQGYVVVSVDNRASAGLSKTWEQSIQGQLYGDVELNDLRAALTWLKAQPWVDAGRLGIWGWSGGGTGTLMAMTRTTAFKAGIAVAPVTDFRHYDTKWTELVMRTPAENPEGYAKTSLVTRAKDLRGRLLLVHGTFDDNVHPQNSQAFMDALIESGKLFDAMVYPMRKHDIADKAARQHLYRTMLEFWKRNL